VVDWGVPPLAHPHEFGQKKRQIGPPARNTATKRIGLEMRAMTTTVDETKQRAQDAEEHVRSYKHIMTAATHVGVPFCLALATFFTVLTMRGGIFAAAVALAAVFLLASWVVKTFFSSH
jgi:VanZ family protein